MVESSACPSRNELQRMVLGQMTDDVAGRIQKHLELCPKCWSALDRCVSSDEFLEAARTSRPATCEPTKTMYVPVEWIRSVVATWMRSHDSTQSDTHVLSMADVKHLLAPPQAGDEIGRIANFRVLRVLGVGGMAVVFESEDGLLKRRVALKLMRPAIAAKPGGAERFLREAQSAAALKHEHVVAIHQVGMHGETPFIALELLHGETLDDCLVRNGRLSVHDVIRIGREIAMGLAAAQARGLVHRDIKPANIWLEGPETPAPNDNQGSHPPIATVESVESANGGRPAGKVKILDFGCAKTWTDESGITYPGLLIGTPSYMAPEQLVGNEVDPRADLFSLGCLLYRMAGGKPPFGGDNLLSVVRALALEEPAPLRTVNPQLPPALCELVAKLLSKSPDDRPATAQLVVDQLWAIEQGLPREPVIEKARESGLASESGARRGQRKKWVVSAVVGLALVLPLVSFLFGAQIIRIATGQGQVVIKVDDPAVEVTVKENRIVIFDRQSHAEINLSAGEHQFEVTVKQPSGEINFNTDKFTLNRGGRKVVEVREELAKAVAAHTAAAPKRPESPLSAITKDQKPQASPAPDLDRRAASWVLSVGGTVFVRAGGKGQPIEVLPGHALPAADFELTKVRLHHCPVTDEGLEHLRGQGHLDELALNGAPVTNAGVECLRGLTELKSLAVSNTSVSDDGLQWLQNLEKLESICLDGTRVSDAGLRRLESLRNLRVLDLINTRVTDVGLGKLAGMPQIRELHLRGSHVTDAGLMKLRSLVNLRVLSLSRLPVTDAGLAHLKGLPQLDSLDLGETDVTPAGLADLRGLKNLHVLSLKGARQIGDDVVPSILKLQQLVKLDLSDTRVSSRGIAALKAAVPTQLHIVWSSPNTTAAKAVLTAGGTIEIRLQGAKADRWVAAIEELPSEPFQITAANLDGARSSLTPVFAALCGPGVDGLVSLDLSGTSIRDADLLRLKELTRLRRLVLEGTVFDGSSSEHLSALTNLEELVLSAPQTTDERLGHLRGLTRLKSLALDRTKVTDAGLTYLSAMTALETLSLKHTAVTDRGLRHVEVAKLKNLVLEGTRISDAGLTHVLHLTALNTLDLTNTSVTDAGLKQLQGLTNLESLRLNGTHVTDAGLGNLQAFKKLHVLMLEWTRVTDAGLKQLQGLPQLDKLWLRGTGVTDAGLQHLRGLTKLNILDLSSLPVTDAGLGELRTLKNLQHLVLDRTRVTNAGLRRLKGLTRLYSLYLGETRVTEPGLADLLELTNLRVLGLYGLPASDAVVPRIVRLRSLQEVDLRETRLSAKGFGVLKTILPGLRIKWSEPNYALARAVLEAGGRVDVRLEGADSERPVNVIGELPTESFQITSAHVAGSRQTLNKLLAAITNPRLDALVALDLSGTMINDADLERLKPLVELQQLNLADTRITDAGLAHLKRMTALRRLVLDSDAIRGPGLMHLPGLPELRELRLGCPPLADVFLEELAGLKKLERLSLAKSNVSDEGAKHLAQLRNLEELDLSDTKVTATRVAELQKTLPQCRIITTSAVRQLARP